MTHPPTPKQTSTPAPDQVALKAASQAASDLLVAAARERLTGTLQGKLVLVGGLAGVGAVRPLAATRQGAACLAVEADSEQIKRAVKSGFCEIMVNDLDEALRILKNAVRRREPASVALIGDCARIVPELAGRGVVPDIILLGTALPKDLPGVKELQYLGAILLEALAAGPAS